jgi:putative methionine-R-sulfoxide reductase with GAF domain
MVEDEVVRLCRRRSSRVTSHSRGSEQIVPVLADGRVVGTLDVEDERTEAFGDDDQKLFEQVTQALTGLHLA